MLVLLWVLLATVIAARRPDRAPQSELPDRPIPPVTIDLNHDPWPRLLLIEGIGEALARRIVEAREVSGGFTDLVEVQEIHGIPDGAIERARPWLRLGPTRSDSPEKGPEVVPVVPELAPATDTSYPTGDL